MSRLDTWVKVLSLFLFIPALASEAFNPIPIVARIEAIAIYRIDLNLNIVLIKLLIKIVLVNEVFIFISILWLMTITENCANTEKCIIL